MKIEEMVWSLLKHGRAGDLAELMDGGSPFSTHVIEKIPSTPDEIYAYRMAIEHAEFVARFGEGQTQVIENGMVYCAYPDFFNQWVKAGCLGLSAEDLYDYMQSNPF